MIRNVTFSDWLSLSISDCDWQNAFPPSLEQEMKYARALEKSSKSDSIELPK